MAYVTISVIAATLVSLVAFRQLLGKCAQPILPPPLLFPLHPIHATYKRVDDVRAPHTSPPYFSGKQVLYAQLPLLFRLAVRKVFLPRFPSSATAK